MIHPFGMCEMCLTEPTRDGHGSIYCESCSVKAREYDLCTAKNLSNAIAGRMGGSDPVSPQHYDAHPSGVQCIEVTEHFNFCLGNAIKYIWRADHKGQKLEDLRKARWYLDREIERLTKIKEKE